MFHINRLMGYNGLLFFSLICLKSSNSFIVLFSGNMIKECKTYNDEALVQV